MNGLSDFLAHFQLKNTKKAPKAKNSGRQQIPRSQKDLGSENFQAPAHTLSGLTVR